MRYSRVRLGRLMTCKPEEQNCIGKIDYLELTFKQLYIYIYISVFAFFRYLPLDLSFENFIAISNLKVIPELEKNVINEQCCQSLSTI